MSPPMADEKHYLDQYDDGNPDKGQDDEHALNDDQLDELQSLVGDVLFQFNNLETTLDWLIAEAINQRSTQPGYSVTAELNSVFTKKVLVFKALYGPMINAINNPGLTKTFEALYKRLFKLKDIRNEVAHADWLNATNKYEVRLKIATDEGGPYTIRKIMDPEFLDSKAQELSDCAEQLEKFHEGKDDALSTDRGTIFGELPRGTPMWCMHCERTYSYGEYRTASLGMGEETMQMCPYDDCDGDAVMDAKEWDWVRDKHPEYPEVPEKGIVYPLH